MNAVSPLLSTVTAAVLAGGRATRMQGQDKAGLRLGERSLLERALAALKAQSGRQFVVSHHDYPGLDVRVVRDAWPGQPGPLAGIYTALLEAGEGDVLIAPGDAPLLPADLLQRLHEARVAASTSVACVHDGEGLQPLCCLLPANLAGSARTALERDEFAVHRWLQSQGPALADFSHWPRWAWSVNTPEEWQQVQEHCT